MKKLHPTQGKLLSILKENLDDPLTVRELQEALALSSPSLVFHHLRQLERNGYIKRNPGNPRDYQVLSGSPEKKVAYMNLYGLAQCGPDGSILDGNPIDRIAVATSILHFPASEGFLVKAKGLSMEPKIHDGDLVLARKTNTAEDGSVVVCVNNGKTLIKRIKKEAKNVLLSSTNNSFDTFTAADDFRIEGEVKGVFSYQV